MKYDSGNVRQCTMKSISLDKHVVHYTAYIPESLAIVGKHIELKEDDTWTGVRWEITYVSDSIFDAKVLARRAHTGWNNNI